MSWDLELFNYYQDNLIEYQKDIDKLKMELKKTKLIYTNRKMIECSICLDYIPNILYLPCRHITNCEKCYKDIDFCPLCSQKIEYKMKIFYG